MYSELRIHVFRTEHALLLINHIIMVLIYIQFAGSVWHTKACDCVLKSQTNFRFFEIGLFKKSHKPESTPKAKHNLYLVIDQDIQLSKPLKSLDCKPYMVL